MGFMYLTQLYPPQTHPFDTPSVKQKVAKKELFCVCVCVCLCVSIKKLHDAVNQDAYTF